MVRVDPDTDFTHRGEPHAPLMLHKRRRGGSLNWTRTSDPLINSQLLYQLSYQGTLRP